MESIWCLDQVSWSLFATKIPSREIYKMRSSEKKMLTSSREDPAEQLCGLRSSQETICSCELLQDIGWSFTGELFRVFIDCFAYSPETLPFVKGMHFTKLIFWQVWNAIFCLGHLMKFQLQTKQTGALYFLNNCHYVFVMGGGSQSTTVDVLSLYLLYTGLSWIQFDWIYP